MSATPSTDPYKVLGLTKDADLSTVKSTYRKLVLKCHPDKFQDPALKEVKQDEFQKVHEAYELLTDETKRAQYDEQMRLYELRGGMSRGGPPPGQSPFDYEIRTAEPRSSSFRSAAREPTRPYPQPPPPSRSYEDEPRASSFEDIPRARAGKTDGREERKRPSTRDGERSRRSEEEREHERWEKERMRSVHGANKKTRDKERRRGSEDKFSRSTAAYVEDDESEDIYRSRPEKKSPRVVEESARDRVRESFRSAAEKARKDDPLVIRTRKVDTFMGIASEYIQASRRKAAPEHESRPKPAARAETHQDQPAYTIRYATPSSPYLDDEDDSPRRSSAGRTARRSAEQIPVRSREQTRSSGEKERRTSPYERDAYIFEASPEAPSAPAMKKPTLQSHTSAPPNMASGSASRREPSRSKTMQSDYPRREPTASSPMLPRASTFQSGDKAKSSSRGSNLKKSMHYASDDSEPEEYSPHRASPRRSREQPEPTRYIVEKGRVGPTVRHRDDHYSPRDRSESPRGSNRRSADRPSLTRSTGSAHPSYFRSGRLFPGSVSPEPIIKDARPKMPPRESGSSKTSRGPYIGEVKFGPSYGPEHVSYSPDGYPRRGSDPSHHRDFAYGARSSREAAYGLA